jgi:15-cis-phytoene synthase
MLKMEPSNHIKREKAFVMMLFPISRTPVHKSRQADDLLARHGKTFHFAARFLPARYRQAVVTLYAFFRTLDDLVDERTGLWRAQDVRQELAAWQAWFAGGLMTTAPREPLGAALAALVQEYAIPHALFKDFLIGLLSDLEPRCFSSFHELHRYCYQVAGTVGLAMAYVLGDASEQARLAAHDLGIAMQLTNMLRDLGRDLAAGRMYLPFDELERFGLTSSSLLQLSQMEEGSDERFRALMRAQIARARRYYLSGLAGVWLLRPDCRLPILLAGRLYQRILLVIEQRRYDVFHTRAATSLFTKVREAGVVFLLNLLWRVGEMPNDPGKEVFDEAEVFFLPARSVADPAGPACSVAPAADLPG